MIAHVATLLIGVLVGSVITDVLWELKWSRRLKSIDAGLHRVEKWIATDNDGSIFDVSKSPAAAAEEALARPPRAIVPPGVRRRFS